MFSLMLLQAAASSSGPVPRCSADRIALSVDGARGDFNGMSHSGTLVMLRNRGHTPCAIAALPAITMLDRQGRALPAARQAPVGMHPGPVAAALTIAPGAIASTPLRWISGDVFDRGRCLEAARIAVTVDGKRLRAPLVAHLCGPVGKAAAFVQPPLRPGTATGL